MKKQIFLAYWVVCLCVYLALAVLSIFLPLDISGLHAVIYFFFGAGQFVNSLLFVPQAYRVFKEKSGEELSLTMFAGFNILQVIGLLFSYEVADTYAVIGYALSLLTAGAVTILILHYRFKVKLFIASLVYLLMIVVLAVAHYFDGSKYFHHFIFIVFGVGQFVNAALYVPQVVRLIQKKKAEDMSLITYAGFNFLQCLGVLFARETGDTYAVSGYLLSLTLCGLVTALVIYYRFVKPSTIRQN